MFALLMIPHWLVATGHGLYYIWPWATTVTALAAIKFGMFLAKELDAKETRLSDMQRRLERDIELLAQYRNGRQIAIAWENAREWEARYQLQLQKCQIEHMDRPLPIRPLNAAQMNELEEELPF